MNVDEVTRVLRQLTAAVAGLGVPAAGEPMAPVAGLSPLATASTGDVADWLRVLQRACDVIEVARVDALAEFESRLAHLDDGAPTAAAWASRELRVPSAQAKRWVKAASTMRTLPEVAGAAREGQIRLEHIHEFTGAVTRTGAEIITAAEGALLDAAKTCDPAELRAVAKELDEVVTPQQLDDAYRDGMDKCDFRVSRVGHGGDAGYAVTGWLDPVTGAKLRAWLEGASAPRGDEDDRTSAQRRVDAIGDLIDSMLRNGIPVDNGFRPQIHVTVELATLLARMARTARPTGQSGDPAARNPGTGSGSGGGGSGGGGSDEHALGGLPAQMTGFGSIGTDLLDYLCCDADITAVLIHECTGEVAPGPDHHDREHGANAGSVRTSEASAGTGTGTALPQAQVLNVGRTQRCATTKQRIAIRARQDGVCANPGCGSTHIEAHHIAWWQEHAGPTDLDNLVGLCSRCHHLVHAHRLVITPDGNGNVSFATGTGTSLADHRRRLARSFQRRLRAALRGLGSTSRSSMTRAA